MNDVSSKEEINVLCLYDGLSLSEYKVKYFTIQFRTSGFKLSSRLNGTTTFDIYFIVLKPDTSKVI